MDFAALCHQEAVQVCLPSYACIVFDDLPSELQQQALHRHKQCDHAIAPLILWLPADAFC
jgi:hypothetical protein